MLENGVDDDNEYDLFMERRHNPGGCEIYASGGKVNTVDGHIELLGPLEGVEATINISLAKRLVKAVEY